MEAFRVSSTAITERLDPGHYRPMLVENDALLRRFGSRALADFYLRSGIGHTAAVTPHYTLDGDGVAFVSGGCIVGGHLELAGAARIQRSAHLGIMSGSRLEPGFVLLVRKGELGNSAVVPSGTEVNCSSEVMFLEMRPDGDSGFVSSYFNSCHGRMAFLRQQRGMMIPSISLYDVPELPVPALAPDAQRYIGDKVRQAERLRARARREEQESSAFFNLAEWTQPRAGRRRSYVTGRQAMRSERLDAAFYDPAHDAQEAVLQARGAIRLSQLASLIEDRWNRVGKEFAYFEIGELDIGSGVIFPSRVQVAGAPSRAQIRVEPWDVLVSTVRPNRKNVGLVPVSDEALPLVASTGFGVLRFATPERAVFYHAFLRSDAATQQLMRWNSGATYPAIESDVPLQVLAPDFDDDVVQQKGARWLKKFQALDASQRLTTVSKLLVEHLIDGRITEADLIAAQKALEAGDRSADRAILQSLRQGDAADAAPLIPDLDGLYALLDEPDEGTD